MEERMQAMARVLYVNGQLVTAEDLGAEQAYLAAMQQREAVTHHTCGILHGLEVSLAGTFVEVSPGIAFDGLGRTLIVPATMAAPLTAFAANTVSIWLAYAVGPTSQASRQEETARLHWTVGRRGEEPLYLEAAGLPVFLGTIERTDAGSPYQLSLAGRPLIGLVGEHIQAASGVAQMECGRAFTYQLRAAGDKSGRLREVLRIDATGGIDMQAGAAFQGGMKVQPSDAPAESGKAGIGITRAQFPPAAASPWTIYRATGAKDAAPTLNQLVIELAGAREKGDPGEQTASLGCAGPKTFDPALKVNCAGDVLVSGRIRVGGKVFQQTQQPATVGSPAPATGARVGAFSLKMEAPSSNKTGLLPYTLMFTNHGSALMVVEKVQEIVTVNDQLAPGPRVPLDPFELEPGKSRREQRSCPVTTPGVLKIAAHAEGSDARSGAVADSAAAQIHITAEAGDSHGH